MTSPDGLRDTVGADRFDKAVRKPQSATVKAAGARSILSSSETAAPVDAR